MRLITCIFLLFFTHYYSFAQGILQGKVTDAKGEVIIGVKVLVAEDNSIITRTDVDGLFSLKFPTSNNYTIVITYLGFDTIRQPIKLQNNQLISKGYTLIEYSNIKELGEVKIVAKQKKSNDYFMDKLKVNSATTIDFISSETMKKTGDQNVTAAITRVSGVSTNGHCKRIISEPIESNISPLPTNCSEPPVSKIVRESIFEVTLNDKRAGKLALIKPVITLTDGRWVATIK